MTDSLGRIHGVLLRYFYLHRRSLPRTLEIFFWPVMELLVWGFLSVYMRSLSREPAANFFVFLINAMIFWDLLYRSQQSVSIAFIEDIWTQNIVNILVSPLKIVEWLTATCIYGLVKSSLITLILSALALLLYKFNLYTNMGLYMIPLFSALILFGWALGIFTAGLVIRYGYAAEALIWGVPFLVQPLSAIFYPVSVLPFWMQGLSLALPSTHVFEGIRSITATGRMAWPELAWAFALNGVYFVLGGLFFNRMYKSAKNSGRLARLGMD